MTKVNEKSMRRIEVEVARIIAKREGYCWFALRDVRGNPSTAADYYHFLRLGKSIVRHIEKRFAGGTIAKALAGDTKEGK